MNSLQRFFKILVKKGARFLILCALVIVSCELASGLVYTISSGTLFSYSDLASERETLLVELRDARPWKRQVIRVPWDMSIHPFFGTGNPSGFAFLERAENDQIQNHANVIVIALTGGSVAQGVSKTLRAALVSQVEERAIGDGRKVHLLLLGQGTWKQPQQVAAIAYYLSMGGKLDLLVNLDGHNEVVDTRYNWRHGIFLAYPWLWHHVSSNVFPVEELRMVGTIGFLRDVRKGAADLADSVSFSVSGNVLWKTFDDLLQSKIELAQLELQKAFQASRRSKPAYVTGPKQEIGSEEEFYALSAEIWKQGSIQLNNLARANGAAYVHFLQPNQYVPGSKQLNQIERMTAYDPRRKGVTRGYPYLLEASEELERRGIEFQSLVNVFREITGTVYKDRCCHVNQRGNEVLAKAMAEVILDILDKREGQGRMLSAL